MSTRVSNVAIVKTVGISIYVDQALTQPLTQIDWGMLEPGQNKNFTGYVKNTANVPVSLSLATENWNPASAEPEMTVTWDYTNAPVNQNAVVKVVFNLKVASTISGVTSFSFTIVVTGTG
jgi:hypothetical protein